MRFWPEPKVLSLFLNNNHLDEIVSAGAFADAAGEGLSEYLRELNDPQRRPLDLPSQPALIARG